MSRIQSSVSPAIVASDATEIRNASSAAVRADTESNDLPVRHNLQELAGLYQLLARRGHLDDSGKAMAARVQHALSILDDIEGGAP